MKLNMFTPVFGDAKEDYNWQFYNHPYGLRWINLSTGKLIWFYDLQDVVSKIGSIYKTI